MNKAEERALEIYPIFMSEYSDSCREYDSNESDRLTFIEGYQQAEKDLELTWKDMAEIVKIANLLEIEWLNNTPWDGIRDCGFYTEVLKRFNATKKNSMTQEDKELLLKDLCERLPYEVKVHCEWNMFQGDRCSEDGEIVSINIYAHTIHFKRNSGRITEIPFNRIDGTVLPYLRPMSSMTEGEMKTFPYPYYFDWIDTDKKTMCSNDECSPCLNFDEITDVTDWLNAHHFDYRGLIEKGLVLEATEGMYNN